MLDHLGIGRAHVSGLSLGSATAQELAINHPAKVASLQLHCTWSRSYEWFIRMIDTNELPVFHDDFRMCIRTALLWVASPHFINERPEDMEAFERGFIFENPHPPSKEGLWRGARTLPFRQDPRHPRPASPDRSAYADHVG